MGQISLSIPQSGQPNSTEDPKVATDLTTIQTVINGNLDDTNLKSPNSIRRTLLMQTNVSITGGFTYTITGQDFICAGTPLASGGTIGGTINLWAGDNGYSSQPQDFTVANKATYGRVKMTVIVNATTPSINLTGGLYQITSVGGGSGSMSFAFGAAVGSSATSTVINPLAGTLYIAESGQFALPTAAQVYALGINIQGGSGATAAASLVGVGLQLFYYNA